MCNPKLFAALLIFLTIACENGEGSAPDAPPNRPGTPCAHLTAAEVSEVFDVVDKVRSEVLDEHHYICTYQRADDSPIVMTLFDPRDEEGSGLSKPMDGDFDSIPGLGDEAGYAEHEDWAAIGAAKGRANFAIVTKRGPSRNDTKMRLVRLARIALSRIP